MVKGLPAKVADQSAGCIACRFTEGTDTNLDFSFIYNEEYGQGCIAFEAALLSCLPIVSIKNGP